MKYTAGKHNPDTDITKKETLLTAAKKTQSARNTNSMRYYTVDPVTVSILCFFPLFQFPRPSKISMTKKSDISNNFSTTACSEQTKTVQIAPIPLLVCRS
jgi:hypothetical protein